MLFKSSWSISFVLKAKQTENRHIFCIVMLTKKVWKEKVVKRPPVLCFLAVLQWNSIVYMPYNFLQYNYDCRTGSDILANI